MIGKILSIIKKLKHNFKTHVTLFVQVICRHMQPSTCYKIMNENLFEFFSNGRCFIKITLPNNYESTHDPEQTYLNGQIFGRKWWSTFWKKK